jgi:hypothetical protein
VTFQFKDAIYITIIIVLFAIIPKHKERVIENYYYNDTAYFRDSIIRQNYTKQIHEIETIYDTIRIDGSEQTTKWLLSIHRYIDSGGQLSTFAGSRSKGKDSSLPKVIKARQYHDTTL